MSDVVYSRSYSGGFGRFMQVLNTAVAMETADATRRISESTEALRAEVRAGNSAISTGIVSLNTSITELGARFNYGLSLLQVEMEATRRLSEESAARLAAIDDRLQNPDRTRALELLRKADTLLSAGLLVSAVRELEQAVGTDSSLVLAHYNLARLLLFGATDSETVVDPPRARQELSITVKLAKADPNQADASSFRLSEALFQLSLAEYIMGNLYYDDGGLDEADGSYRRAMNAIDEAIEIESDVPEYHYHRGKYRALLGDRTECLRSLNVAAETDPHYLERGLADPDYRECWPELAAIRDGHVGTLQAVQRRIDELWRILDGLCQTGAFALERVQEERSRLLSLLLDRALEALREGHLEATTPPYRGPFAQVRGEYAKLLDPAPRLELLKVDASGSPPLYTTLIKSFVDLGLSGVSGTRLNHARERAVDILMQTQDRYSKDQPVVRLREFVNRLTELQSDLSRAIPSAPAQVTAANATIEEVDSFVRHGRTELDAMMSAVEEWVQDSEHFTWFLLSAVGERLSGWVKR